MLPCLVNGRDDRTDVKPVSKDGEGWAGRWGWTWTQRKDKLGQTQEYGLQLEDEFVKKYHPGSLAGAMVTGHPGTAWPARVTRIAEKKGLDLTSWSHSRGQSQD